MKLWETYFRMWNRFGECLKAGTRQSLSGKQMETEEKDTFRLMIRGTQARDEDMEKSKTGSSEALDRLQKFGLLEGGI